jgi:hypothetical protein
MSKTTCAPTAHDFDKFDEATIYCRHCGEQRVMDVQALIASIPRPIYMPCPGPHWPQPTPYYPWIVNTSDTTGTVTVAPECTCGKWPSTTCPAHNLTYTGVTT